MRWRTADADRDRRDRREGEDEAVTETPKTPEKPKKIRYTSRSLERHVRAPRERTWAVLLDRVEAAAGGYVEPGDPPPHGEGAVLRVRMGDGPPLVETVLSFEPPWRRSCRIEGDHGLDLYEGTFVVRDDGDESHLSWGLVVDPEPSERGWAFVDLALGVIGELLDEVAAEAGSSTSGTG